MANYTFSELQAIANEIREDVIKMLLKAGSGHSAGSLGTAEIFTTLYLKVLKLSPGRVRDPKRDRFVLSAGHLAPVWYAVLARAGFIDRSELKTLRQLGSPLQGHPHNLELKVLETSSGPLGQGLSQAIGMALAGRLDHHRYQVYCLMSDGEQQEGQVWEALMFAGKEKLNNLTAIVDRNFIQISGGTEEVMPLEPLADKYRAFSWLVLEVDGHDCSQIVDACNQAQRSPKPTVIIAHTTPGKGVSFMEGSYEWHGKAPEDTSQAEKALRELRTLQGKIEAQDLT